MYNSQCKVCAYGPQDIDWNLSNRAVAEIIDCSERSVRRHKKHSEDPDLMVSTDSAEGGSWVPRRKWDAADGTEKYSYQFVPDTSPEDVHVDNDRIDRLIRDWPFQKLGVAKGETEFAFPADTQFGKAGEEGGGTPETLARFHQSIERVAQRWERNRPEHGYLCEMGDIIENLFSTPQQASTNDRTLPEQIEDATSAYMNAIGRLLPLVGTLHHATVTSNHGEARTAPKVNPYNSENDWGLYIQRVIQGKCEDRGWDVVFHRPDHNEDTTVIDLPDGTVVALNHGHHAGSPKNMRRWVEGQVLGRRPGWDADIWVHGHFHHPEFFPFGDSRTVFGTPALDGGSAWHTRKTGEKSDPGIVALTVSNHGWTNYSIL